MENELLVMDNETLAHRIENSWGEDLEGIEEYWASVIGGEILWVEHTDVTGMNHSVVFAILHKPKYKLDHGQLCRIADDGNHCLSEGSIMYEDDYVYIMWSTAGHI